MWFPSSLPGRRDAGPTLDDHAHLRDEFSTLRTGCPVAVAYLVYLVRKFQQNGVVEWWGDGKMEITDEKAEGLQRKAAD